MRINFDESFKKQGILLTVAKIFCYSSHSEINKILGLKNYALLLLSWLNIYQNPLIKSFSEDSIFFNSIKDKIATLFNFFYELNYGLHFVCVLAFENKVQISQNLLLLVPYCILL